LIINGAQSATASWRTIAREAPLGAEAIQGPWLGLYCFAALAMTVKD
jgi:hypothetical protein